MSDQKKTWIPSDAREVYNDAEGNPIAFCPVEGLGITDIQRASFFNENKVRLAELEARAETKSEPSVVICIDVDDATWSDVVNLLMPAHDWHSIRARGETPVARGVVPRDLVLDLAKRYNPAAGEAPPGAFSAVFAAGGITFFQARKAAF